MVEFKDRLAAAMKDANVTKTQLAGELGISYQAVKKLLEGTSRSMSAANNAAAARYLNVSSEWLATGKGPARPQNQAPTVQEPMAPYAATPSRDQWLNEAISILTNLQPEDRRAAVVHLRVFVSMLAPPASGQALQVAGKKRGH